MLLVLRDARALPDSQTQYDLKIAAWEVVSINSACKGIFFHFSLNSFLYATF